MSDGTTKAPNENEDYGEFGAEIADQVESFLLALREIARGEDPSSTLSLLLLEVSQLALAGGRLGAIADIVPKERFEPDTGPDADVDELRERLAKLLDPVDTYVEVLDPVDPDSGLTGFRLSDELASIAADLLHGLSHYRDGRTVEALWWWQFSYLSSWGSSCGAAMRTLHSLIAHTRLDHVPDDEAEAEERTLLTEVDN
ncbi:DUF5063 domain-containing protein [Actinobacteria bacterium YIM 96077]|uniref:DUF5063 domain-containing protein n=1 Tax=Phytoactinopolyspora halophila TaxID=1981511 RepID=A0A329R086_9ACTN|nr:DUF5063 domain-containing protein [Phytoactinopolyspora halophila]AYY11802.1 DUF5063 domain-containing protein [Actinobacteria bacterium YIM 96077]RAW17763.1 DUF5063 domain-containing protein [Phytoactinopolyspora halophila]